MDPNNFSTVQGVPTAKISRLPNILMILGIAETIIFSLLLIYYLFLIPQLIRLYSDLNIEIPNPYTKPLLILVFIVFSLVEAYYGHWLKKIQKTKQELPMKHRRITYGIFCFTLLLLIFYVLSRLFTSFEPLILLQQEFRSSPQNVSLPQSITREQAIECVEKEVTKKYPNKDFRVIITGENETAWFTSVFEDKDSVYLMGFYPVNKLTCKTHFAIP